MSTAIRIHEVEVTPERILFRLADGREVSEPLERSRRLAAASAAERGHWRIVGGTSVHWPDVDEDIGLWELLGVPEEFVLQGNDGQSTLAG